MLFRSEDKRIWCDIGYDDRAHKWYTYRPAPLEYGLGPYQHNPSGINIDSDTEQPASDSSEPSEPSHDTPTQSTLNINLLTTPMASLTFATTHSAPVLPGSSGGLPGGGGGPPAAPAGAAGAAPRQSDKLGGNPPQEFTGDREKSR